MTRNEVYLNTVHLNNFCGEKTFEICAIKHQNDKNYCILYIQISTQNS